MGARRGASPAAPPAVRPALERSHPLVSSSVTWLPSSGITCFFPGQNWASQLSKDLHMPSHLHSCLLIHFPQKVRGLRCMERPVCNDRIPKSPTKKTIEVNIEKIRARPIKTKGLTLAGKKNTIWYLNEWIFSEMKQKEDIVKTRQKIRNLQKIFEFEKH